MVQHQQRAFAVAGHLQLRQDFADGLLLLDLLVHEPLQRALRGVVLLLDSEVVEGVDERRGGLLQLQRRGDGILGRGFVIVRKT